MEVSSYQAGKSVPHAIKLSSNESPFPPSRKVRAAMRSALSKINRYPPADHTSLHRCIANTHAIDCSQVVLGNGSDELIASIARSAIDHNYDQVLISKHTFSIYTIASQLTAARIQYINTNNGHNSLQDFITAIGSNTKLIFLCNPNNPTGTYLPLYQVEDFIRKIPHHITIVLDHAYDDFIATEKIEYSEYLKLHPRVVLLKTLSKIAALAGARVGFAIGNQEYISEIKKYRMPFNISLPSYNAALSYLSDTRFTRKLSKYILAQRSKLESVLSEKKIKFYPSQANFLCIDAASLLLHLRNTGKISATLLQSSRVSANKIKRPHPADQVFEYFAQNQIIIRSLTSFDMPQHVRISIGTPREMRKLYKCL